MSNTNFVVVFRNEIKRLKQTSIVDADEDYSFVYYPVKIVDVSVQNLILGLPSSSGTVSSRNNNNSQRKEANNNSERRELNDHDESDILPLGPGDPISSDNDSDGREPNHIGGIQSLDDLFDSHEQERDRENKKLLKKFNKMYPDIDLDYMLDIINENDGNVSAAQDSLESKIGSNANIPLRKVKQEEKKRSLILMKLVPQLHKLWSCPECGDWQVVSKVVPPDVISCKSILNCGDFCPSCNKAHFPLKCRSSLPLKTNNDGTSLLVNRSSVVENEVVDESVFNDLNEIPDQTVGNVKFFNLIVPTDLTSKCPKEILYRLAEIAFNRKNIDNVNHRIGHVKYIENKNLKDRFDTCKLKFMRTGVPVTERLVFHGTNEQAAASIYENGFLMSKVKRSAMGFGMYFSEDVSVCTGYGNVLIVSRALIGVPNMDNTSKAIAGGFDSKIVKNFNGKQNSDVIVISKEDQIVPVFEIVLSNGRAVVNNGNVAGGIVVNNRVIQRSAPVRRNPIQNPAPVPYIPPAAPPAMVHPPYMPPAAPVSVVPAPVPYIPPAASPAMVQPPVQWMSQPPVQAFGLPPPAHIVSNGPIIFTSNYPPTSTVVQSNQNTNGAQVNMGNPSTQTTVTVKGSSVTIKRGNPQQHNVGSVASTSTAAKPNVQVNTKQLINKLKLDMENKSKLLDQDCHAGIITLQEKFKQQDLLQKELKAKLTRVYSQQFEADRRKRISDQSDGNGASSKKVKK